MSGAGRRSPWMLALARRYVRRRVARGLDGLRVRGLAEARAAARDRPLVLAANHVGWWDSLLVVALDEALGTEGYALMDAGGLRRVPYFARLGALPLDRSAPPRMRAGLRAAAGVLDRPGRALWTFPQGRYRPAHLRPLGFERGLALLSRLAPAAAILPVSIAYAWGERPGPAALVRFGPVIDPTAQMDADVTALAENAVAAGLAEIDAADPERGWAGWGVVIAPRGRAPEQGVGARMLARGGAADG
ncbi:MAG TPA: lysophospholipid acyltransferase family protein [Longimicrobiaceae bacterium]|nr:lysophospholipid acyltransferase family protein [Longimicrobiaceae bacterium]